MGRLIDALADLKSRQEPLIATSSGHQRQELQRLSLAQPPPPTRNTVPMDPGPNHGANRPDTTPDVERIEPPATAAKASNSPHSAPISRPASQGAVRTDPSPATGVAPALSDGRPVSSLDMTENREGVMQHPAPTAAFKSHAAATTPAAASPSPHLPQAPTPQAHPEAPVSNMNHPPQLQPSPSLSQQVSPHPGASLPSIPPAKPPTSYSQTTAPTPSPANHTPQAPIHTLPSHTLPANMSGTPGQNRAPHRTPSDQFSRSAASPAPSQTPFREPHTPSALDPYTVDNVFGGGGYHLPDAADSQLTASAYVDQCNQLYAVLRTMHPSVVRRIVRDTWQTSLAGSEAHISFVLNVVMHKCTGSSARVAVSKFGNEFVKKARWELMMQFTPSTLAEMGDLVVDKAPDSLLDKAMEKRLGNIPARSLLNMLARAERLGYDERDIISEEAPQAQNQANAAPSKYPWIPTAQPDLGVPPGTQSGAPPGGQPGGQPGARPGGSQPGTPHGAQPGAQPPPPPQGGDLDPLICPLCLKWYPLKATRDHHWRKKICQKPVAAGAHYKCHRCDQTFTTSGGLDYHGRNKVCGDDGAPAATASPHLISSAGSSPASFTPANLPSTQPQAQHANRGPPVSTPARPSGQGTPNTTGPPPGTWVTPVHPPPHTQPTPGSKLTAVPAGTPPVGSQMTPTYDPYAHLTAEKRENMQRELDEAEVTYAARMDDVRQNILDPLEKSKRLDSLRNSFATKQSMVRKKYGVRLRERRSKAAIEEQRKRMAGGSQVPRVRSPLGSSDVHANKRAKTGTDGQSVATQGYGAQEIPTRKHAASADVAAPLSGGLAAAHAAPETMDPTRFGGGLAVGRPPAYGSASQARPAPQPTPTKPQPPVKSPAKPLARAAVIEVSSNTDTDSDSDSDDEIPAQLPPPPSRASQSLSKPAK